MAAINPVRSEIQQEDTAYRRSVSEAILTKVGAQNNFINKFQTDTHRWVLNGSYSVATGIVLFDGLTSLFYNSEIVGVSFWNGISGASGTTEFDLNWINTSGVDQGSIFSVTPKINSTASNLAYGFRNLTTSTDIQPTGVTLPTFSKTTFSEGEAIYLELNSAMTEAQNCGIAIYFKPIN